MLKSNIGIVNALMRITIGFTIIAWATAKLVKKPWRDSYLMAAMMGSMKVAEGITRFCPVTALFDQCKVKFQHEDDSHESHESLEGLEEQINPS